MRAPGFSDALDFSEVCTRVDSILGSFLDDQERIATAPDLELFIELLREMLSAGGKRIRPILCVIGWHGVSEQDPPDVVFRMAASLELFHMFALIHDDVMDKSDLRRGRLTAHRVLANRHSDHPNAEALGANGAILLGDLALGWSYDLLGFDSQDNDFTVPWPVLNAMRTETLIGQYLDLLCTGARVPDIETAWQAIRYKTAKYSFERPLHLGALLAGATDPQIQSLSTYALPLGEAFQLRDDLLGSFGNPDITGKPQLDDLREGKHTVLIATAFRNATPAQLRRLRTHFGNPQLGQAEAEEIRTILVQTGAMSAVEQMIDDRYRQAVDSLHEAPLHTAATTVLRQLAATSTARAA